MNAIDKSVLPEKFKAWIYQNYILPSILWPLLVYEFPLSTVEGFEMRISCYFKRCLRLPKSLSSIALYSNRNKLMLPFNTNEEFRPISHAGLGNIPTTHCKLHGKARRDLIQKEVRGWFLD